MKIDLHIHTTYSDGTFSPEKIVDAALNCELDVIALTDHDNILSYDFAQKYLNSIKNQTERKLEIIQGVEINTLYKGYEVHILGYFMDVNNSEFKNMLKYQQNARVKQTKEILKLLKTKENIDVKYEDLKKLVAQGGSIGRPHIAKAVTAIGGTSSVIDAYSKFIHSGSNVYVERKTISPFDAVEIIYDAGGIPVFAHPFDVDIADKLILELMTYGLRGVEAYHRKHSPAMVEYFSSIAEKNGLIVTGGSDFHSPNLNNGQIYMGKNFVPDWIYNELLNEKKRLDLACK